MNKKKINNNTISILVISLVIILGLWVIIIYPLIKFNSNEKILENAGKRYFQINNSFLPQEGETKMIDAITLVDKSYMNSLRTAYNNSECDLKESWVKVRKTSGEYKYYPYLKCGILKSRVDHTGPIINLKGKDVIEIEKDEKFEDPGINNVKDNTDGDLKVDAVNIKSDVDTSKIGEYTITYSAVDSFLNRSEVTRKVIVSQSLNKTVLKDTDNSRIYKGSVENNYIKFSGQIFRIVGLNDDDTVKIVSDEDISQVDYKSLDKWLNDYYYEHIADSSKEYIVENYKWCTDTVKNTQVDSKISCDSKKNKENVGLLAINEYNSSLKEGESYLYTDTINWTSSSETDSKAWTTRNIFFGQDSKYLDYNKTYHFNVRPSIVLKKNIKIIDGDGTVDNPYDIGDFHKGKPGDKLNTRYSGEFIIYGGVLYRIVEIEDDYVKVISVNSITDDTFEYGSGNVYNPNKNDNIGYTIENNISKYTTTKLFVKHSVTVPIYEKNSSYDGKKTEKKYNIKFSAPNLYDMYSSSMNSCWYINSSNTVGTKYVSSENGTVYYDMDDINNINSMIRFTAYLKKSVEIVSGSGTADNPYKISD